MRFFLFLFFIAELPASFANADCKIISDEVLKLAAKANAVEIKEDSKAYNLTAAAKIKALLNFIKDHNKDWCKPQFSSAPSGKTSIKFKDKGSDLWSFKLGTNFIGEGWYIKDLSEDELKAIRKLIEN